MQSIPSDHYPPTPYSVDLNSPTSSHDHYTTSTGPTNNNNQTASNMGYIQNPLTPPAPPSVSSNSSSPNRNTSTTSSNTSNNRIDIPLHELIGAAEAVEADLLESFHVGGHSVVSPSSSNTETQATETGALAVASSSTEAVQKKAETASIQAVAAAAAAVSNKPKNMASPTCSTSSSINSSCWKAGSQHASHR